MKLAIYCSIVCSMLLSLSAFKFLQREVHNFNPYKITNRMKLSPQMSVLTTIVNAVAEAKPDDYVYGAVAAPSWVLPLGAVLTILTAAAIPAFLKPGEEALNQQRENESITNNKFNKKKHN